MINPHWPHLPKRKDSYENEKEKEVVEGAWRTITDDPLDYHFYYHILDGDEGGRPPKVLMLGGHGQTENKYFNWRDKSCLHVIAKNRNMVSLRCLKKVIILCVVILCLEKHMQELSKISDSLA